MRIHTVGPFVMAMGMALAVPAAAVPCYMIVDNTDTVLYRDTAPPFDLSAPRSPQRAALRARGNLLLIAEFENCNAVGYISKSTGGTTASVDEIVMQLKPAALTSIGGISGGAAGATGTPSAAKGSSAGSTGSSSPYIRP